jgi:transposase
VPLDAVDVVGTVTPERCRRRQHSLSGAEPHPQRHQVSDIPPAKPVVTAYHLHRLVCPVCGDLTQAEVPAGMPTGSFGPRMHASAALCTGAYHRLKRPTPSVLEDLFGIAVSVGTMANLEHATMQAVAEPMAEAQAYVSRQSTAYLDETGWREGWQGARLWTAVTACATVFVVRLSRSAKVARKLLGKHCWGYLVTDRWSAYTWDSTWRRQVCWAHRLRDIEAMSERRGPSQAIGEALQARAGQIFHRPAA